MVRTCRLDREHPQLSSTKEAETQHRFGERATPMAGSERVSSFVPLASLNSSNSSELGLVHEHKQKNWLAVHLEQQPFVVAGDVLLSVAPRN